MRPTLAAVRASFRDLRIVWVFLLATAVILGLLAAVSAAEYGSVAQAHALTTVELATEIRYTGLNASGVLGNNGSVSATVAITVLNPSPRVLDFDSIAYKVWVEDLPAEAGLPNLGRTDQVLTNETGTYQFYMAFFGSFEVSPIPIPASGQATLPLTLNLTHGSGSTAFAVVQNITQYAAAVHGIGAGLVWMTWVQLGLPIEGVPSPDLTAPTYEFDVGRVVVTGGTDLGG